MTDYRKNQRDKDYIQIVVWEGVKMQPGDESKLENILKDNFKIQHPIRPIGTVETLPGLGGPGGRHDYFFLIHNKDIRCLSTPKRLLFEFRWWEDVLDNDGWEIYDNQFIANYTPRD